MAAGDTYTAPADWATNEKPVASTKLNQQVRDNLYVAVLAIDGDTSTTTIKHRHLTGTNAARPAAGEAGRLYYATDDPKIVTLDDGTNLQIVGGDMPRCRVTRTANQSIPNDTVTAMLWDSEHFDNDTMHSTVSNTGRITLNKAGIYEFGACIGWTANTTGRRLLTITKNIGQTQLVADQVDEADGSQIIVQNVCSIDTFSAGDYLECLVRQASTIALNAVLNTSHRDYPVFWARMISGTV